MLAQNSFLDNLEALSSFAFNVIINIPIDVTHFVSPEALGTSLQSGLGNILRWAHVVFKLCIA